MFYHGTQPYTAAQLQKENYFILKGGFPIMLMKLENINIKYRKKKALFM